MNDTTVPGTAPAGHRPGGGRAWVVWGLGAVCFGYAFFLRAAPSVMVDPLMATFSVGAAITGNLAALYLYVYAGLQIPIGILLDRTGPRKLLTGGMALAGAGALTFALAPDIWFAYAGRLAIGAGCAVSFISGLTIAAAWFPPRRFGMFSGLTMGTGMVGGFLAQGPLGGLVDQFGWRAPLVGAAVFGIVLALAIWLVVRDRPDGRRVQRTGTQSLGRALSETARRPQNWILGIYGLCLSGPFLAYGLLWGVPHLMLAHGVSRDIAGFSTSLMSIGFLIGGPLGGFLSDRIGRRKPSLVICGFGSLALWVLMLWGPELDLGQRQVLIFLTGLFGGSMIIMLAAARELSPASIGGVVTGFVNGFFVGGGALLQPLVGFMLDRHWDGSVNPENGVPVYTIADFDSALIVLPAACAVGSVLALFVRESHCRPLDE